MEKAKSNGDLFDILSNFPDTYPVRWDDVDHCWKQTDLLQTSEYQKKGIEEEPDPTWLKINQKG